MEVKINKEIRDYTESVFFGLSVRQLVFSGLAVGVAVALFFLLRGKAGTETLSWVCVLAAFPFAAMGFVRYHGMSAEQLLFAVLRSEIIEPNEYAFEPQNAYFEALKDVLDDAVKETYSNVEVIENTEETV